MAPTTTPIRQPAVKTIAENVKDTLESIVVAFILAFVFRAFIVEAFVIPTGSMAVTLYGNQVTKTCSVCGYEYAVGITERMQAYSVRLRCPNCDAYTDELTPADINRPDSGDRILVHKWPLNIGGEYLGPHRWDVTVFKDPKDGTTNFIKRLVGLPGEVLEIIDGDVYAAPLSALPPELIEKMNRLRLDVYQLRERQPDILDNRAGRAERAVPEALCRNQRADSPAARIQRKLPGRTIAQESLWFIVYNNDFLPHYRDSSPLAGGAGVGWRGVDEAAARAWTLGERELRFQSDAPEPREIQFVGKEIDDFYAYNIEGLSERSQRAHELVGDVRFRFVWIPESGSGGLVLRTNRDEDEFAAAITMDGSAKIDAFQPDLDLPGHHQVVGERKLPPLPRARGEHRVYQPRLSHRPAGGWEGADRINGCAVRSAASETAADGA